MIEAYCKCGEKLHIELQNDGDCSCSATYSIWAYCEKCKTNQYQYEVEQ